MPLSCWPTAPTGMRSKPSSTEAVSGLGVSATVSTRDDADAVRVLYEDIDNDQRFWNALSALVLLAAALAAFNLINRIVEAQRREIGIGMALGVPRPQLAVRPMMIGVQVAVLGTVAGLGVGLLVGNAFGNLLESFLPLPDHRTPFQFGVYLQAALLGIAIPIAASADPGLAGAARRADRGDPYRSPRRQDQSADRLDRPSPTARFDHDADADPQRAAHPAPHGADRRRCRRRDHRSRRRARDARQLRPDPRSGKRRVHQGRRRPCRRAARHVLPRATPRSSPRSPMLPSSDTSMPDCGLPATALAPEPDDNLDLLVEFVDLDQAGVDADHRRGRRDVRRGRPGDPAGPQGRRRSRRRQVGDTVTAAPSDPNRRPAASRSPTASSSSPASTPTRSGRSPSWTSPTPRSSGWRVS